MDKAQEAITEARFADAASAPAAPPPRPLQSADSVSRRVAGRRRKRRQASRRSRLRPSTARAVPRPTASAASTFARFSCSRRMRTLTANARTQRAKSTTSARPSRHHPRGRIDPASNYLRRAFERCRAARLAGCHRSGRLTAAALLQLGRPRAVAVGIANCRC